MKHPEKPVVIRKVWAENLLYEFSLINRIALRYPYAAMDTEFPGTVFQPDVGKHRLPHLPPDYNYGMMKANVDALNLIQLGLTLSDADGNLPDLAGSLCYIWEFNFSDFDVESDLQNPDSIALLERQGIDFHENRAFGIDSRLFALLFLNSQLAFRFNRGALTWITFHSAYDFGYLIKILTGGKPLPENVGTFMSMVDVCFGGAVYDIKHMIRYCDGLYGGLERVAKSLNVDRMAGKSHQAGSDSLLTTQTFMKLKESYFNGGGGEEEIGQFQGVLHGLEVERKLFYVALTPI